MTATPLLGHVAGLPLEEMAPAILGGASLLVATLFRAVGAKLGRISRFRNRLGSGPSVPRPPR